MEVRGVSLERLKDWFCWRPNIIRVTINCEYPDIVLCSLIANKISIKMEDPFVAIEYPKQKLQFQALRLQFKQQTNKYLHKIVSCGSLNIISNILDLAA